MAGAVAERHDGAAQWGRRQSEVLELLLSQALVGRWVGTPALGEGEGLVAWHAQSANTHEACCLWSTNPDRSPSPSPSLNPNPSPNPNPNPNPNPTPHHRQSKPRATMAPSRATSIRPD